FGAGECFDLNLQLLLLYSNLNPNPHLPQNMDLLIICSLTLFTIPTMIIIWLKANDAKSARDFAARNLKFVKFGNLLTSAIFKQRIELLKSEALKQHGPVFGFNML